MRSRLEPEDAFETLLREVARAPGRPPFAGTRRYEVIRPLGSGGFGTVYEVLDRQRGHRVALKLLHRTHGEWLYRFKREFRALADVSHPSLVTMYDLGSEDGQWFFTMERIDGVPLHRYRDADEGALRRLGAQLAEGISALHRRGLLHGDIKPANVMVEPGGRVVLLDFGLTRPVAEDAAQAGTPAYASPEQCRGEPTSEASDWYALGVLLYERLTDRLPFRGTASEMTAAKRLAPPPAPRELVPGVASDLDALCVRLLSPDPAERPRGPEIVDALGGPASDSTPGREAFVGREDELEALRTAFAVARSAPRPVAVLVQGPSGIGKTALAARFVERAREQAPAASVLSGRCYEREAVAYKAFDEIVDALARTLRELVSPPLSSLSKARRAALGTLFPVLGTAASTPPPDGAGGPPGQSPDAIALEGMVALRELLAALGERGPLILSIDDVQWADPDSARLLRTLLRPPEAPPILLLATCRDDGQGPLVRALDELHEEGAIERRRIALGPLDLGACAELASAVAPGAATDESLRALVQESQGMPFALQELLRARTRNAGAPPRLADALDTRLAELPPEARLLLEVVSLAARPVDLAAACEAAGQGAELAVVEALRKRRLLRMTPAVGPPRTQPYHDVIRKTVVAAMQPPTARDHHRRLAQALEASDRASHEELAEHWLAAGERERGGTHAVHAARAAREALAFERAARLYAIALEALPLSAPRRAQLLGERGEMLAAANRGVDAGRAFLEAATCAAGPDDARRLRRLGVEQLLRSGHVDENTGLLRELLAAEGITLPRSAAAGVARLAWHESRLRLRGLAYTRRDPAEVPSSRLARVDACWTVAHGLSGIDPPIGASFISEHARLALDSGDPARIARGLAAEAHLRAQRDPYGPITQRIVGEARRAADLAGDPYSRGIARLGAGAAAIFGGHMTTATRELDAALEALEQAGRDIAWEAFVVEVMANQARLWRGQLPALAERLPEQLRQAEHRSDRMAYVSFYTGVGCIPLLAEDDPDRAERLVDDAMRRWGRTGVDHQIGAALSTRMWIATYAGEPARAVREFDRSGFGPWRHTPAIARLFRVELAYFLGCSLVAAALESRSRARRAALLGRAGLEARRLDRLGHRMGTALAPLLRGSVLAARDRAEAADLQLAIAERRLIALDARMHAAAARRLRGLQRQDGERLVADADSSLAELGVRAPARMAHLWAPGAARPRGVSRATRSAAPAPAARP